MSVTWKVKRPITFSRFALHKTSCCGVIHLVSVRILACLAVLISSAAAQDRDASPLPRGGPAEQARAGRPGPWDRDVVVYRVSRGGDVEQVATFERAGVPTIARLADGRLIAAHQHFPADFGADFDKVAVHFSNDDGRTWSAAEVIQLVGLPEGMRFPFDPTIVPLLDGRVRLYFTSTRGRRLDASTPAIYSAVSRDGIRYEFEPGVRFGVEGRMVIDCAVVLHRGIYHLFAPDNGAAGGPGPGERGREGLGYHATSSDGLSFTRAADVQAEGRWRWLGNAQSNGEVITFYGTGAGLGMLTSPDGAVWTRVAAPHIGGGDPGAVSRVTAGLSW